MYNMMTCEGGDWVTGAILGDCSMAWFSLAIIIFLCLIVRRQTDDGILSGMGFNLIGAFVLGLGANLVVTAIFGAARWSLVAGVVGLAVGGLGLGLIFPNEGGSE